MYLRHKRHTQLRRYPLQASAPPGQCRPDLGQGASSGWSGQHFSTDSQRNALVLDSMCVGVTCQRNRRSQLGCPVAQMSHIQLLLCCTNVTPSVIVILYKCHIFNYCPAYKCHIFKFPRLSSCARHMCHDNFVVQVSHIPLWFGQTNII